MEYLGLKLGQDLGNHTPTKNSRGVPPPPPPPGGGEIVGCSGLVAALIYDLEEG